MGTPKIVTGSDRYIKATWKVAGVVTAIPATATVKAVLVSKDNSAAYTNVITMANDLPGADWPSGIIMLLIPATETAAIDYQGFAQVELQVDDGQTKTPGFFPINIIKGHIG